MQAPPGQRMMDGEAQQWLLLIHQLPPRPDYVRVKVRRRLRGIGAVALKQSVYVLPASTEAREDFQWLATEISAAGGDATICSATMLSGVSDGDLQARFRDERDADYRRLARIIDAVDARSPSAAGLVERFRQRLDAITAMDFFSSTQRAQAERSLRQLQAKLDLSMNEPPDAVHGAAHPNGAIWVTRAGVFIDRIASAWLIRRFIDPAARFRFVDARSHRKAEGEIRFDMYQGEFTHVGDRCTFEMLLVHFGLDDPALEAMAEIVHDIDLKDAKFGRQETAGIAAVVQGLAQETSDDLERIQRGSTVFEGLYRQLSTQRRT